MSPFDVILFDVGGVLLTNGWDRAERAAAVEHFDLNAQELETRHMEVTGEWERGEIDRNQYLDAAVFYKPRSFSRDEFFDFILAQSQVLPDGALPILAEISAANQHMLGALNNEARETNEFRFGKFELRRYLKVAFSSCYVGMRKPERGNVPAGAGYSGQRGHNGLCLSTIEKRTWRVQGLRGSRRSGLRVRRRCKKELKELRVL